MKFGYAVVLGALLFGCGPAPADKQPGTDGGADGDVVQSAMPDVACTVGAACGNDCTAADDACWNCGTLAYDEHCVCRPQGSACSRPDCSAPGPAAEGQPCGTYWWCQRECAAGLTCRLAPESQGPDASPLARLSYVTTCQRP